jgi:hypothetical protein
VVGVPRPAPGLGYTPAAVGPEILIVGDRSQRGTLIPRVQDLGYIVTPVRERELSGRVGASPAPAAVLVCLGDADAAALVDAARRGRDDVPVILYGSLGGELRDLADVLELGADHFLEASASDAELASVLAELAGPGAPGEAGVDGLTDASANPVRSLTMDPPGVGPVRSPLQHSLEVLAARLQAQEPVDGDGLDLELLGLERVPDVDGELGAPELADIEQVAHLEGRDPEAPPRPETTQRLSPPRGGMRRAVREPDPRPAARQAGREDRSSGTEPGRRAAVREDRSSGTEPGRRAAVREDRSSGTEPGRRAAVREDRSSGTEPGRRAAVLEDRSSGTEPGRRAAVLEDRSRVREAGEGTARLRAPLRPELGPRLAAVREETTARVAERADLGETTARVAARADLGEATGRVLVRTDVVVREHAHGAGVVGREHAHGAGVVVREHAHGAGVVGREHAHGAGVVVREHAHGASGARREATPPRPEPRALLRGERLGGAEVLQRLWQMHVQRGSGRLLVGFVGGAIKQVWWRRGVPVYAASSAAEDGLLARLQARGLIGRGQLQASARLADEDLQASARRLVEAGLLKPREQAEVVRDAALRIVESLCSDAAERWLLDAEPSPGDVGRDANVLGLLASGARLGLSLERLREDMPESTCLCVQVEDIERLAAQLDWPEAAQWLGLLDGGRSLGQLVEEDGLDERELWAAAQVLWAAGLAQPVEVDLDAALVVIDRRRIEERLALAGSSDYFALLGVARDAGRAAVLRAHADLRETFAEERLEPRSREELADELAALRVALDEAREVLLDEALRAAYLAHLGD